MMKKTGIFLILVSGLINAQVTIEKTAPSATPASVSVSLELGNATGGRKGILLPWVTNTTVANLGASVYTGTLFFDTSDQSIKLSTSATADATTAGLTFKDLSIGAAKPAIYNTPDADVENTSSKAIIGITTNANASAPGILVLSDTDKAMVLPRVNAFSDIVNPSAGMLVYITSSDRLAVYNGKEWSFWTR